MARIDHHPAEKGVEVDARSEDGKTALVLGFSPGRYPSGLGTAEGGHTEVAERLLAAKADPTLENKWGSTARIDGASGAGRRPTGCENRRDESVAEGSRGEVGGHQRLGHRY